MDCKDIMTDTLACTILNIEKKHTFEMRKKAYFKMALRHHPDKPGGNKEKFQNVKEAYDFLNLKAMDPREETKDLSYIGKVMPLIMQRGKGKVDGKMANSILRSLLE